MGTHFHVGIMKISIVLMALSLPVSISPETFHWSYKDWGPVEGLLETSLPCAYSKPVDSKIAFHQLIIANFCMASHNSPFPLGLGCRQENALILKDNSAPSTWIWTWFSLLITPEAEWCGIPVPNPSPYKRTWVMANIWIIHLLLFLYVKRLLSSLKMVCFQHRSIRPQLRGWKWTVAGLNILPFEQKHEL